MSFLSELRCQFDDIRRLGPSVLRRVIQKQDSSGYTAVTTRFGPFHIRRAETDYQVLRQIFVRREYDLDSFPHGKAIRSAYEDLLQRGKTPLIIDAGANAGFAARFFAQAYPLARILCIEPEPANAAICRHNTRNFPHIEVFEAAIGARSGHVTIERNDAGAWGARTHLAESGVPVMTMNDLRSRYADTELLIVKIDIEGFEGELFASDTEWIADACSVIVEPHDWMLPGAGTSRALQRVMGEENCEILISGDNLIWVKSSLLS